MFLGVFLDFINNFAKKYRFKLALLVISSTIAACFEFLGLSLIYAFVALLARGSVNIPILSKTAIFQTQSQIALILGTFVALAYISKDIFMIIHINFQNSLLAKISNDIFQKNYAGFISQNYFETRKLPTSDKFKILDNSIITAVNSFCGSVLSLFANTIVAFAIIFYLFAKFQTNALIIASFVFAIWYLENKYLKEKAKKHGKLLHLSEREKYNFVLSTINSQKDIIVYNKKEAFTDEAAKLQKKYSKERKIIATNAQLPTYLTEIGIMSTFMLFVVLLLLNNYDTAHLSAGLATVAAIIIRLVPAINKTQYCLQGINASKFEVQWFCNTVLSLYKENIKEYNEQKMSFEESIKFKNIYFCYEKDNFTLKNINFELKKGDFIGITGSSGSGKTTLFNIICALFNPDSGKIQIDDTILDSKNVNAWQNNISILSQEFSLPFNTVWQNVALEPNIDSKKNNKKIIQALKYADVYDDINGDLEKNPQELSSGQKHRIALARAFYFNREIIMLDEATSALDVQTEDEISKSIEKIKGKKTIIAIAHRLKTLKNCDKIIYMDKGEIIGIGTLSELKEKHQSFKQLIELSEF